jgi:CBS domain-containing protein
MLIHEIFHPHVKTIHPDMKLGEVVKRMEADQVNGYVVQTDSGRIVGILSLQDIAGAIVPKEFRDNIGMAEAMYKRGYFHDACKLWKQVEVRKVMRKDFLTVSMDTNILAVMADFLNGDLYIVPVVDHGKLVGIITRSEIRAALIDGFSNRAPKPIKSTKR